MSSRSFGRKSPHLSHRVKPRSEVYDLRKDVEEAFDQLEGSANINQATWYLHPTLGHDDNDGATASTALKTFAEFAARCPKVKGSVTLYVLAPTTEIFHGTFFGVWAASVIPKLIIVGTPTVLASGTATTYSHPNFATPVRGKLTSAEIPSFTSYVGKIIEWSSGPASTAWQPIAKDIAGEAQLTFAVLPNNSSATPTAGSTFNIIEPTSVGGLILNALGGMDIEVQYLKWPTNFVSELCADFVRFRACEIGGFWQRGPSIVPVLQFYGCCIPVGGSSMSVGSVWGAIFTATVCLKNMFHNSPGGISCNGFLVQGSYFEVGGTTTATFPQASTVNMSTNGLGIFDSPSDALIIRNGSAVRALARPLGGNGNAGYGLKIESGGILQLATANTPALTGTSGDLIVAGAATAIPPLQGGAAVPAAAALTTWAELKAAPFNGSVMNYADGTRISP